MTSEVRTHTFPDGSIQRVHTVHLDGWESLRFLRPDPSPAALSSFARIYRKFLVPACPWLFGQMVLFRLPEHIDLPLPMESGRYGTVADRLTAAAALLRRDVTLHRGKPRFRSDLSRRLWQALEAQDCIRTVCGRLPTTVFIPVAEKAGFLTECEPDAAVKVNASFFIMDRFDCATVYDQVGTPFGLCVKDGIAELPPLYGREALLVKRDGSIRITALDPKELTLRIGSHTFRHGENCTVYTRPQRGRTPFGKGLRLVVSGNRIAAVKQGGSVPIPASGFVICPKEACAVQPGDMLRVDGQEDVVFGIQVGNSILRSGIPTDRFLSRFYNIRALQPVPFPPSLYPLDFCHARAARIALGADCDGRPMLLWAEGAAKIGYQKGTDSRGASLSDMTMLCREAGMVNAVNLDGGGSAQLLLRNRRSLQISDRGEDGTETERPVPLALMIR